MVVSNQYRVYLFPTDDFFASHQSKLKRFLFCMEVLLNTKYTSCTPLQRVNAVVRVSYLNFVFGTSISPAFHPSVVSRRISILPPKSRDEQLASIEDAPLPKSTPFTRIYSPSSISVTKRVSFHGPEGFSRVVFNPYPHAIVSASTRR